MKTIAILLGVLLTFFTGCKSERVASRTRVLPSTLEDAAIAIIAGMDDADKRLVRETPADDLIQFHMGWGMGIRNSLGLWGGNEALLKSCGEEHPDDASMVIIQRVWRELRDQYMPVLSSNSAVSVALREARIGKLTFRTNNIPQAVSLLRQECPRTGLLSKMRIEVSPQLAAKTQYPLISMTATNIPFQDALNLVTEVTHTDWYVMGEKILIW